MINALDNNFKKIEKLKIMSNLKNAKTKNNTIKFDSIYIHIIFM